MYLKIKDFMPCVNKVFKHVREKLDRQISLVHNSTISFEICPQFANPFQERFTIGVALQWGSSWKRAYGWHLWNNKKFGTTQSNVKRCCDKFSRGFPSCANETRNADCLLLQKEDVLKEPEEVAKAVLIPTTLKIHQIKRVKQGNTFSKVRIGTFLHS